MPRWVKALFGFSIFLGSTIGLILLYKYRGRFNKKNKDISFKKAYNVSSNALSVSYFIIKLDG